MSDQEGGQSSYCSGPLQFIRIESNGSCHLEAQAATLLSEIKGRLAIVGVAGLYRTGKSFLLNRLLGLQDGFEIGPSVNPCTKGLWIWGQPVQIETDFYCIYVDTEGLGSTQRTASCDMQIFSLCILLSSFFIYNSMGAIDEQAIDELHLVLNLAKHIHLQSSHGRSEGTPLSELAQCFPSFLWALRDFHLEPVDEYGKPLTEKGYLENALKPVSGQEDKNRLREVIKELFTERDCVTLPRPCRSEDDLRHIQKMPYESLRPKFREKVEAFVATIYNSVKPKMIKGNHVSGQMFVSLASEYCKSINSCGVPTIHSAWTSVVQHQLRLSLHDATKVYESNLAENALRRLPIAEEELQEIHKTAKAESVKLFLGPKFDANDPQFLEFREELAVRVKQMYEHAKVENATASLRLCEASAQELYSRHIAPKLEGGPNGYARIDQLLQDWDKVQTLYQESTAGPAKAEVLSRMLARKMAESTQRVCMALQDKNTAQLQEMRQKLINEEANSQERARKLEEAERRWRTKQGELDRQIVNSARTLEHHSCEGPRAIGDIEEPERNCAACSVT